MTVTMDERRVELESYKKVVDDVLLAEPSFQEHREAAEELAEHPFRYIAQHGDQDGPFSHLPPVPEIHTALGDHCRSCYTKLEAFLTGKGFTVIVKPSPQAGMNGETQQEWKLVMIDSGLAPDGLLEVAIHETAHVLIHESGQREWGAPKEEELVSAATALIAHRLGLDWMRDSSLYTAMYSVHAVDSTRAITDEVPLLHGVMTELEEVLGL